MKSWKTIILTASAAIALQIAPAASDEARVADGGANIRSGPGSNYRIIASVSAGVTVQVGRCVPRDKWCRIVTPQGRGWISVSRLAFPYTGRPGEEDYGTGEDGKGGTISADGETTNGYVRITGPVVDKPGYCYAISRQNTMMILKCP